MNKPKKLEYNEIEIANSNNENIKIKVLYTKNKNLYLRYSNNEYIFKIPYFIEITDSIKNWLKDNIEKINLNKKPDLLDKKNEKIFIFGNEYSFSIIEKNNQFFLSIKNLHQFKINSNSQESIKQKLVFIQKHYLELYLKNRQKYFEELMNIPEHRFSIREKNTSWASNSVAKKHIVYNPNLVDYPSDIIDYVIVHELSHHLHPNHSQKFWYLVEKFIPKYKQLREKLNHHNIS